MNRSDELSKGIRTALDLEGGALSASTAQAAAEVLRRAEARRGLGSEHTVVAFAGSTGSGKSSLFNAVSGLEIAEVGVRRPTTSEPIACVWGEGGDDLLDWLEVPKSRRTWRESALDGDDEEPLRGLILIDLPDHDSTAYAHREVSDRLIDMVDVVFWVVDPQKYADFSLHNRYLSKMSAAAESTVVVLNQVDRLDAEQKKATLGHLRSLLEADGMEKATVAAASAVTREGVPEIRRQLVKMIESREAGKRRIEQELADVAGRIRAELGRPVDDPEQIPQSDILIGAMNEAVGTSAIGQTVHDDYARRAYAKTAYPLLAKASRGKADPLGARHGGDREVLLRAAQPELTQPQTARINLAAHEVISGATRRLPAAWKRAAAAAEDQSAARISADLESAVSSVDISHRRPGWWGVASFFQWLFFILTILGIITTAAAAVLIFFFPEILWTALPNMRLSVLGLIAAAPLMIGIIGSIITSVLAANARRKGADDARAQVEEDIERAVHSAAKDNVFEPVTRLLRKHRETYHALS